MERMFRDRREAGRLLGDRLQNMVQDPHAIVLALPRGGVPVGFEVAMTLHAQLDVMLVRKLGLPGQEELAMGAIASGGVRVLNREVIVELAVGPDVIDRVAEREQLEIERRERIYRNGRPAPVVSQRTVILVDDGLATGATMLAALRAVKAQDPKRVIVAVPVAAPEVRAQFAAQVDEIVCLATPHPFYAVGMWYEDFSQTSDEEVSGLLERAALQSGRVNATT